VYSVLKVLSFASSICEFLVTLVAFSPSVVLVYTHEKRCYENQEHEDDAENSCERMGGLHFRLHCFDGTIPPSKIPTLKGLG
jgi:hypothetical protein